MDFTAIVWGMTTTCAVPSCTAPRVDGDSFCPSHGPKARGPKPAAKGSARANVAMVCPHCQVKGSVTVKQVKVKSGISGGKATGAVLTVGVSVLATGLSKKRRMTEAHCGNCGQTWHIS